MKKYSDSLHPLEGRVVIKKDDWYLISVDDDDKFHWLQVKENESDPQWKSFIGVTPHTTLVTNLLLDGERVHYPKPGNRYQ